MRCPCRKKSETVDYAVCCQPYHLGLKAAPTAEALMRSRYAAFAMENAAYVTATWHRSTMPSAFSFTPGRAWLLLKVLAAHSEGDQATVEFEARSRVAGQIQVLHEISRFVREGGRWFYVDGVVH